MMKRIMTILLCSLCVLPAMADDGYEYPYMVFTTVDGSQTSVSAVGLQMVFSSASLTVYNDTETVSFTLSELKEMHFSENGIVTDIQNLMSNPSSDESCGKVYDLQGRRMTDFRSLPAGIYLFKQGSVTTKIHIK